MSDDSFTHDVRRFAPETAPGGVDIADAEARYADLFGALLWDGPITAAGRRRLEAAVAAWGLTAERAAQIEASLLAAESARDHFVNEDEDATLEASLEPPPDAGDIAPIAPSEHPGMRALQRRIGALEEHNDELLRENFRLSERNDAFETLVQQLQYALESTMDELDAVRRALAAQRDKPRADTSRPPPPPASSVQRVTGPPAPPSVPYAAGSQHGMPQPMPTQPGYTVGPAPAVSFTHARLTPDVSVQQRHDPAEIHRRVRRAPRDPQLLRALYRSLGRSDDLDRRWCISHALAFLDEANSDERALYDKYASEHLVRPRRAVNDDEWRELLFHPAEDELTGEILSAIAPAVLLGQLTAIRASIAPELIDPALRVDPKQSTLQAVRCIDWAAAFLGLRVPALYACPAHDGMADIVLNPTPCTRLGKRALSRRTHKELAFIAGRHLSWYRPEHLLGNPNRSTRRLEAMFLAALMIGNPGLPLADDIRARVEPIANTIRPLLDATLVEKLQHCFGRFVEYGGRTNLGAWLRGADRTADCTGLFLCNDLWAARSMLAGEDPANADASIDDLICFVTADRYSMLRRRVGIAINSD